MRTTNLNVPEITDERLAELAKRIRPVFRHAGKLHWMMPCNPRNQSFTWDPTPAGSAKDLEVFATIQTVHTYAYYGFFKPTVAEVLAQIPEQLLPEAVAFETVGPSTTADMNKEPLAFRAGLHVAHTILFRHADRRRAKPFNARELATVLAALRYFQRETPVMPDHFATVTPLRGEEIDVLCERLNQQ